MTTRATSTPEGASVPAQPRPTVESTTRRHRVRAGTVLAGLAVAWGFALRVRVLGSPLGASDSDEAVVALIGSRLVHGHVDVMYWGQNYGGTLESFLAAPVLAAFGPSVLAGKLVPVAACAAAAVLTWRIGRRTVGEPGAAIGALVFWTTSAYFVWFSTKINIYYATLVTALVVVLLLLKLRDEGPSLAWSTAFGLAAGAAVWASPQSAYLLVPAALVFSPALLRHARWVALSLPAAVVGASPWLAHSIDTDWATLRVPPVDVHATYLERVAGFFRQLPIVFGARLPFTQAWLVPRMAWAALAAVLVTLVAVALYRRRRGVAIIVALIVGYALVYAVSPQAGPGGSQPRYLLLATPLLALLIATVVSQLRWRGLPVLVVPLAVVCVAATIVGLDHMQAGHVTSIPAAPDVSVPADIGDLVALLDDNRVDSAYADYWLSYLTTLEARERIIVSPVFAEVTRFEPYARRVAHSARPGFIVLSRSRQLAAVEDRIRSLGVPFETKVRGDFAVILPARPVAPEDVTGAYRLE